MSGSGSRRHTRARNALVVCQIALALILLIGAGLLLRSFDRLRSVALGIQPANVLTFEVHLPSGRYQDRPSRARVSIGISRPASRRCPAFGRPPRFRGCR